MADRVVFDCMLFLQQAARPNRLWKSWETVQQRHYHLQISDNILEEVADVLRRPAIRKQFPIITDDRVAGFIGQVITFSDVHHEVPSVFTLARDPKDSKYIDLAIFSRAKYLVTRDNDLLDLKQPQSTEGEILRQIAPDLEIITPEEFAELLG